MEHAKMLLHGAAGMALCAVISRVYSVEHAVAVLYGIAFMHIYLADKKAS